MICEMNFLGKTVITRLLVHPINLITVHILIMFLCGNTLAGDDIVKSFCMAGFEKHAQIPLPERDRYCSCLSRKATAKLSNQQINLINEFMVRGENNDLSQRWRRKIEQPVKWKTCYF
jgi:hypothetical protein